MNAPNRKIIQTEKLVELERNLRELEDPRKILQTLCEGFESMTDFAMFFKLSGEHAGGWVFHGRSELAEIHAEDIAFRLAEEPRIRKALDERVPVVLSGLNGRDWDILLMKRGLSGERHVAVFPLVVGPKTPFLFLIDRDHPFGADELGAVTSLLAPLGFRFAKLILDKRGEGRNVESEAAPEANPEISTEPPAESDGEPVRETEEASLSTPEDSEDAESHTDSAPADESREMSERSGKPEATPPRSESKSMERLILTNWREAYSKARSGT